MLQRLTAIWYVSTAGIRVQFFRLIFQAEDEKLTLPISKRAVRLDAGTEALDQSVVLTYARNERPLTQAVKGATSATPEYDTSASILFNTSQALELQGAWAFTCLHAPCSRVTREC